MGARLRRGRQPRLDHEPKRSRGDRGLRRSRQADQRRRCSRQRVGEDPEDFEWTYTLPGTPRSLSKRSDDALWRLPACGIWMKPWCSCFSHRLSDVPREIERRHASVPRRVDPDARRRSRAANMVGVLALDPQLAPTFGQDFLKLVQGAIDSFRYAVELDPSNADAKRNLE